MAWPGAIATFGAGRMGRSIAVVFAYAGFAVQVIDAKDRADDDGERVCAEVAAEIAGHLRTLEGLGVLPPEAQSEIAARIQFVAKRDAAAALAVADVVFEGVPEVLEAKRASLAFASRHMRPDAILASATSTMLVDQLADFAECPERFLNAHWLNPAFVMPLVEVSPGRRTHADVVGRLRRLLEAMGKVPVICAASPGYIVPRIQTLAMNEAARLVEEGVATAEDIDKATRYGLGFRFAALGLLEFIDFGGGDILYYASRYLAEATGEARFAPPDIIARNMAAGRIGVKSGEGFYDHRGAGAAAAQHAAMARLVHLLKAQDLLRVPGAARRILDAESEGPGSDVG
jgi:3-hydroxybutyryl-CoA dehydrogenase